MDVDAGQRGCLPVLGSGAHGQADHLGTRVMVNLALLDEARVGEWVIIHAGFAISKLNDQEAKETLDLLRQIAAHE